MLSKRYQKSQKDFFGQYSFEGIRNKERKEQSVRQIRLRNIVPLIFKYNYIQELLLMMETSKELKFPHYVFKHIKTNKTKKNCKSACKIGVHLVRNVCQDSQSHRTHNSSIWHYSSKQSDRICTPTRMAYALQS